MGNVRSQNPQGQFELRKGSNGTFTIYLRYFIGDDSPRKSTRIKVQKKDWDEKKQEVKLSHNPRNKESVKKLNIHLKELKEKVDRQIREYDGILTSEIISKMLSGDFLSKDRFRKEVDFIQYCLDLLDKELKNENISYKTWYNKQYLVRNFKDFVLDEYGENQLLICNLTSQVFDDYKQWRKDNYKKCKTVTHNKCLVPLYQGIKSLYNEGHIDPVQYNTIYGKYINTTTRYTSDVEETTVRYLTQEQLQDFMVVYKDMNRQVTREYMEMFLFSVNTGLRVSDIITLEWKHIDLKSQKLKKKMVKTGVQVELYLNNSSIEILQLWKRKKVNKRFVFNLLDEKFDVTNHQLLSETIDTKNRTIQQSLRSVGKKMGLPFPLTLHRGRHTFSVLSIHQGIDIYMLSQLLGHTSIKCVEKTYGGFFPDRMKDISQKLEFGIKL
jgi:integrase